MSKLALLRDSRFQLHMTPDGHPESAERLAAIDQAFYRSALEDDVKQLEPRLATEDEIALVHDAAYIEELESDSLRLAKGGDFLQVDPDTYMSSQTFDTAKLAAGAGLVAVEAIRKHDFESAFVAVRPPGHHASVATPMGFCLFNNIAVAARYGQSKQGYKRILIVDWDVHHGNGTQDIFYRDPNVCFISLHQYPFWPPNSGWYTEDGAQEGKGFNINVPLPEGTGDRGYLAAWDKIVRPIGLEYEPDLILVSAGYDAHRQDPLGGQKISTSGFAMLSQRLKDLSDMTGAKVVCFLEGGYNVRALSESAIATMRVLNADSARDTAEVHVSYLIPGAASGADPITNDFHPNQVDERIEDVRKHFSKYWKSFKGA
jgi:acetoin utilization deacetylase AcuC-like enzyme